uniref:Uncharacterized protein n=1 Tax=Branchiostoma floridae TaxID=7739 RepID=C3XZP8_BRAFL|eukprot:XP_002610436.1 hypothetical protein BRAFLDRAFT_85575 [Branchiostoma floridae]
MAARIASHGQARRTRQPLTNGRDPKSSRSQGHTVASAILQARVNGEGGGRRKKRRGESHVCKRYQVTQKDLVSAPGRPFIFGLHSTLYSFRYNTRPPVKPPSHHWFKPTA